MISIDKRKKLNRVQDILKCQEKISKEGGNVMFRVVARRSGTKYVVYSVREQNGGIEFLLYRGKWVWVEAEIFEPINNDELINEIEEKYKMW